MDNNSKSDHLEAIKQQIDEALKEIEKFKNQTTKAIDAAQLEKIEKDIAKATDKLAGLLTAKVIQESLDSDEMQQKTNELVKSLPDRMKNQGLRDVKITPARGGPVTVKATYFSKKNKKRRKKKKS